MRNVINLFSGGQTAWKDLRGINKDAVEFLTGVPSDQLERGVEITNVSRHSMQHGSRVRYSQTKIKKLGANLIQTNILVIFAINNTMYINGLIIFLDINYYQ